MIVVSIKIKRERERDFFFFGATNKKIKKSKKNVGDRSLANGELDDTNRRIRICRKE